MIPAVWSRGGHGLLGGGQLSEARVPRWQCPGPSEGPRAVGGAGVLSPLGRPQVVDVKTGA